MEECHALTNLVAHAGMGNPVVASTAHSETEALSGAVVVGALRVELGAIRAPTAHVDDVRVMRNVEHAHRNPDVFPVGVATAAHLPGPRSPVALAVEVVTHGCQVRRQH